MVNIKVPLNPVQKRGLWPPKAAREYTVLDTDDWSKIASREHMDAGALIQFNFQTQVPEEVNWYLKELVGCRQTKDGRNYAFLGADPKMRKIYLPIAPPPPCPNDFSKSFEIELKEASRIRQQSVNVAQRFFGTVGAVGRTGRHIPTIIDTKYWFAKLYEITTGFEINAARDFQQPGFVLHFIPIFYNMYNRALDAWPAGGPAVSPLWRVHFMNTGRPDAGLFSWAAGVETSITTGTIAHVRGDMSLALESAYRSYVSKYCLNPAPPFDTYKQDFMSMGAVFGQARLAARSLLASLGPIPEAGVKFGDEVLGVGLSQSQVEQWRVEAWADAKQRLGQ
jgi:Family of unknown function (DUF5995)